jgi:hypothetical protein
MPADSNVMINLATSLVSVALLVLCGEHAYESSGTVIEAVRWGAMSTLVAAFY